MGSDRGQTSGRDFPSVCFWLLLRRPPIDPELEQALQSPAEEGRDALVTRITSSPEFQQRYRQRQSGREDPSATGGLRQALDGFGDGGTFVSLCYEVLFGRPADAGGLDHYTARLRNGASRVSIVETFSASEEFEGRVRRLPPAVSRIPHDVQLCELANPAKWDNPEWHAILRSLATVPTDQASMHRKAYEYAQTIFGLRRLGRLDKTTRILSVGAGHEVILYWLANHVDKVIATDLYEGEWQSAFAMEGNPDVLRDPAAYAPFPYRQDRLLFLKMDGSRLGFRDRSFDVAYSLSSIEHFGGVEGARRAVADMARVLKPGGILALATEWCVRGRAAGDVFSPEQVRAIIDHPRLRLVEPIDDRVWDRYETEPVDLRVDRFQTPHMLLKHDEAIFTSVFVFLEKT